MKTGYRLLSSILVLGPLTYVAWGLPGCRPQTPSSWSGIPLQQPRPWGHTATLLNDGKVLIVGGERPIPGVETVSDEPSNTPNTTEIFDPALNNFVSGPRLLEPRINHAAARLPHGGVLIAGGRNSRSAIIFDPVSRTVRETGSMLVARQKFSAVPLADGRVLVFGGGEGKTHLVAEIYDPIEGQFTRTGDLIVRHSDCPGTLLKNGRVLLAGGTSSEPATYNGRTKRLADAELFDPASGKFQRTGSMVRGRAGHTATLLQDGRVLVAGGINEQDGLTASAEIYDPAKGTFRAISPMKFRRTSHAAALLRDGRVFIAGGGSRVRPVLSSTELFDPKTETFTRAKPMACPRADYTATVLNDGRLLLVGLCQGGGDSKAAELLLVEGR